MPTATRSQLKVIGETPTAPPEPEPNPRVAYVDPTQAVIVHQRSFWKQPARAYMDTAPADRLLEGLGINFNVSAAEADSTAKLLAEAGFTRARMEIAWGSFNYEAPTAQTSSSKATNDAKLAALLKYGLRPLILLNSYHGSPCPFKTVTLTLTKAIAVGDTTVKINPAELSKVVIGRTGFNGGTGHMAGCIFTAKAEDGTLTLSQPAKATSAIGSLAANTLLYEPFRLPFLTDGVTPNPLFAETMGAWEAYIVATAKYVKAAIGSQSFDVEIWNELSFGSAFLGINNYYNPAPTGTTGSVTTVILAKSVEALRNPANEVNGIKIGDGFANQNFGASGTTPPPGLTAIDKHPYKSAVDFPAGAVVNEDRPLNGKGELDGKQNAAGKWEDLFIPTYTHCLPEYWLGAVQTADYTVDISPKQTKSIGNVLHGRFTHIEGEPPREYWVTETNLLATAAQKTLAGGMTNADMRHTSAKNLLRSALAFINKGMSAVHFYGAKTNDDYSVIDAAFFAAIKAEPATYPGAGSGGETVAAIKRLMDQFAGAEPITATRTLALPTLVDFAENAQWVGNGSEKYPDLFNWECLMVLPFQLTDTSFLIPVYVKTLNVYNDYGGSGPTRFDMPQEKYRFTFEGVNGVGATVSAYDPLTNSSVPVTVKGATGSTVTVELNVTDSPRLISITEA